jgi:hypothetical protein
MRIVVGIAAALIGATTLPVLPAQAAPGGSYMQSCNSVRDTGRGQMSAQCRDTRGRYQFTTLDYSGCQGDIGNNNGQLICNGGRPGNPGRPGGGNGPGPGNGGGNGPGPGNGGGWNGRLPGGSWQRSCRGGEMRGSRVTAECKNERGRWIGTSIDMRSCRSDLLGNRNGDLVCG